MKTTVNIPENELAEAMRFTGAKTKREAIVRALKDFNRRNRVEEVIKLFGKFKSIMTNEEIEALEQLEGTKEAVR
jgi:hypothetical protein